MNPTYVSRINQLDALQLDDEIFRIFQNRMQEIGRSFKPGIIELWSPELNAALKTLIWLFSLGIGKSTFGQKLLDLNYANLTRRKAISYLFISVITKYLNDKYLNLNRLMISNRTRMIRKYLDKIVSIIQLLSFLNLLMFLHRGRQPNLLEKIVNISSHSVVTHKPRTIGYSYVTRELLWHGLLELFTIGLPMINFHCMKQYLLNLWPSRKFVANSNIPTMTKHTTCPYCNQSPILPRHAGCSHIYCYYCMMAHFTVTESFNCIICGTELHSHKIKIYSPSRSN